MQGMSGNVISRPRASSRGPVLRSMGFVAPRVFLAREKHSVLPERSPCSAVLPEHFPCSAVLSERSRVPPCYRGLRAVFGSKRVHRTSLGLERSLCSSPLFSSRGTFESPPKCDYEIGVRTRLSPRKQKGWRRRHPFLAERLLMRTLFGKMSLALSWETSPLCVLPVSGCA